MPPRFDPPDDDEILRQAKRLQRLSENSLSNRTVVTATLGSAFAGLCALIYAAWFLAQKSRDYAEELRGINDRLTMLTAEFRNGKGRWNVNHEVEIWQDFARRNSMLKLDMPDPHATKLKVGD